LSSVIKTLLSTIKIKEYFLSAIIEKNPISGQIL
jgi:hypothetical protein